MTRVAIREFYDSPKGFQPFSLHLTSGRTVRIEHRENMLFTADPDTIVVVPKGGPAFSILSIAEIAEIESAPGARRNNRKSR